MYKCYYYLRIISCLHNAGSVLCGMVLFGSVQYKLFTRIATNGRDSTSVGRSDWKVVTNQLALTVSLQLVQHSRLSSSLI